ncbi:MAG TPA: hypothetical protein ENN60_04115 [archaeon]|nr:hypothetical protein [archaeon]
MEFKAEFPLFMLQFRKPAEWMFLFGQRHGAWLKKVGDLGVIVAMFCMPLAFAFLVKSTYNLLAGGGASIALMIPGVEMPGTGFRIPVVEGLLAILLIAIFHEGMHGLMAGAEGVKAKWAALLLLLVIPAAGVELGDAEMKKMGKRGRLRVLAAGSMGNFILAALALVLFLGLGRVAGGVVDYQGIRILNVTNPEIGLVPGDVVVGLNGVGIKQVADLVEVMKGVVPGEVMEIVTLNGTVSGRTIGDVEKGALLGVLLQQEFEVGKLGMLLIKIVGFLGLLFQFNLGVGVINLLPVGILDGGRMAGDLFGGWSRKIGVVGGGLLIFNLVWPYLSLLING